MTKPSAKVVEITHGTMLDLRDDSYPSMVHGWRSGVLDLQSDETHFGIVVAGKASVHTEHGVFELREGFFFSVLGPARLEGDGVGMISSRLDCRGTLLVGGPITAQGRFRYIDGCSDSMLIAPQEMGEPCLNFLCMPPCISQTAHTHPSFRVGVVISGRGECRTPIGTVSLLPGKVFVLFAEAEHSFHTTTEGLRIVVFHPDSDFGPTHDNHPMVNRTYVKGRPAALIEAIRTR